MKIPVPTNSRGTSPHAKPESSSRWRGRAFVVTCIGIVIVGLVGGACRRPTNDTGTGEERAVTEDDRRRVDDEAATKGPEEGAAPTSTGEKPASTGNRLARESSPYLRQHAHNPVDWYPWGDEAFEAAKAADKPVFLSIGYSTCHWCHVMERESFENEAIAAVLNEHFVAIKVDREERPDVDAIYMAAVQRISGRGGWPLSVFLTPDREPFFGGTYYRPDGFRSLLLGVDRAWRESREAVNADARNLTDLIRLDESHEKAVELGDEVLRAAFATFEKVYDGEYGGFGRAPKFPRTHSLSFLLRYAHRTGDDKATAMVVETLDRMARGGIRDHLAGGFHRYSTDREWLLPHFEKMLYDQALIARSYLEAYQWTRREEFAQIAREIFEYVLRDMTDEHGAFHSAEDADSEGVEGKFYVWTEAEIVEILGEGDAEIFARVYGVESEGNFRDEATGVRTGENILHLARPTTAVATELGSTVADLEARLAAMRGRLWEHREGRVRPRKDDKVLADWNGLMISALALGGRVLDEPRFTQAATRAADRVLSVLRDEDGRLLHRYRAGHADIPAFLDDHAFLAFAMLDLFESTFDPRWIDEASRLASEMAARFAGDERGGYFSTPADAKGLLKRARPVYDGAVPSGNSVAALVLARLGRLTSSHEIEAGADAILEGFSAALRASPTGSPFMLQALDERLGPPRELVIAGRLADPVAAAMLREVRTRFLPRALVVFRPAEEAAAEALVRRVPFVEAQRSVDGMATAYACTNYTCELPATDLEAWRAALDTAESTGASGE